MSRRLLFIVNEALFFTTHRFPIGLAMQAAGWDVHVAAPDEPVPRAKIEAAGFTFHPIPLARGGTSIMGELRLLFTLAGLLRRVKPDLLHLVAMKPVIWGGLAARLLRVPAVTHAITGLGHLFIRHSLGALAQRALVTRLYRFALHHANSVTIFQNEDDRELFLDYGLVERERIMMIAGCGVDLTRYTVTPEPPEPKVVLFPARIIGDKGVREFVDAARLLRQGDGDTRFVLVGRLDPENPTAVSEAELGRWIDNERVEHWGFADNMPAVFARAHVVVMPSYREGLPRVLIEAAACGKAIVTTDVPGCRAVVRHAVNGLLVPARDPGATAAAIHRLLADDDLRLRLAAEGRAIAEAEFSVEGFVAASLAAYRRVVALPG